MAEFKCNDCNKEFSSQEGLDMHMSAKHSSNKKESINFSSKKAKKWFIFSAVLIVFIAGVYGFTVLQNAPGQYDDFAQCLTDSGTKMFGAYWCPHCADQKKAFGKSWKNVDYIECSLPNRAGQTQTCADENIQSYPTWEFPDGTRQSGFIPLEQLALLSGCSLE